MFEPPFAQPNTYSHISNEKVGDFAGRVANVSARTAVGILRCQTVAAMATPNNWDIPPSTGY